MTTRWNWIAVMAAGSLLSACGGGDGAPSPAPVAATDAVPPSASATTQGLKNYLVDLTRMPVDDKEPLDLSTFAPPTDDTAEPDPLG